MTEVWRQLLTDHVPNSQGRCQACTQGGTGIPMARWPCGPRRIAEAAAQCHARWTAWQTPEHDTTEASARLRRSDLRNVRPGDSGRLEGDVFDDGLLGRLGLLAYHHSARCALRYAGLAEATRGRYWPTTT